MPKICYYGDKLSTNIAKTPEGFLICRNVPIARTGYQEYLQSELVEDGDPSIRVNVYRAPDEVFSQATLASFEGKPVTNGHPDEDVTPDNYAELARGHVQNVRVGKGTDSNKIIADLYITDQDLIEQILSNAKREVSAGYCADDVEDDDGQICQTRIRGNHVAVVEAGRAGHTVAIRDSKCHNRIGGSFMRKNVSKRELASAIRRYLRDADTISNEALEERLDNIAEALSKKAEDACKDEAPEEEKKDAEPDVWEAIDEIRARIEALEASRVNDEAPDDKKEDEDVEEKKDADPDDVGVVSDEEPFDEEDEIELVEADDEDPDDGMKAKDEAIKAISKAALKIKNPDDRKRVMDAVIKASGKKSQMPGLMSLVKSNKAKRDSSVREIDVDALQKIYDNLNPHKAGK